MHGGKLELRPRIGLRYPVQAIGGIGTVQPDIQRVAARARQRRIANHGGFVRRTVIDRHRANRTIDDSGFNVGSIRISRGIADDP